METQKGKNEDIYYIIGVRPDVDEEPLFFFRSLFNNAMGLNHYDRSQATKEGEAHANLIRQLIDPIRYVKSSGNSQ